ncbi:MAG: penicillin acylase family protein, partial [Bacteroidota bacterium]
LRSHSEATKKQWPSPTPTLLPLPKLGSNNYALASEKSKSGKVIVCNDPHLDARLLPGIFHPVGLFCPDFKGVGLAIPGIPGLVIGRNEYVAFGVTNAYGDSQDLVVEKTSGDQYLYQGETLPFELRQEVITVKDSTDVEIAIRSTVHGPVISDFDAFGIMTKDVVSLQWSQALSQSKSLGVERFLETKNAFEFREALFGIDNMFFNYVFGDVEGNIAHQTTGLVPKRVARQGQVAQADGEQAIWDGFIPKNEMPHSINTERGWIGTANHDTRPDDYPYYYSSHFSPDYRFKRLKEVLDGQATFDTDELWQLILDCKNMQAEQLAPLFATALSKEEQTSELATVLQNWNYLDEVNEVGPTVYHFIFDRLLNLILDDELPDELEEAFWKNNYYWSQRIDSIILADHSLVDNQSTPQRESLDELIVQAGLLAKEQLREQLGDDLQAWQWGKIHTVQFSSPIRQEGFGSDWCGGETLPKDGSNQTLNRGGYAKTPDGSFETGWFSTFRMVADLGDDEKIMGALSGGSSARVFHPYYRSQLDSWKTDEWIPYWLSEEKVEQHAAFTLVLE